MNIFENYTAIELEIAKRDPGFAVVSNVGYAPFHSQLMYLLQQRGVDVSVSPVEHRWRLPSAALKNDRYFSAYHSSLEVWKNNNK